MEFKTKLNGLQLIASIFTFCSITSFSYGQFYPVPETEIDLKSQFKKEENKTVKSFSISNLITVKEFNEYLNSIKKDSTAAFYLAQLPKSMHFSKELVQAILVDATLQDKPMPGVSWSVARNYCVWLTLNSRANGLNYNYDLPFTSELIAYNQFYKPEKPSELESWSLNAYDESMHEFKGNREYIYSATSNDPPSMKRKEIYGGSYHMDYKPHSNYNYLQYEYQDSSSRYIGFRIVRKIKETNSSTINANSSDVTYRTEDNKLHGIYEEKYANGNFKVLGAFYYGQRVGVWSVWDTNSVLLIQRDYSSNKVFSFLHPITDYPYKNLYEIHPVYIFQRNKDDIFPYLYVEERAVSFSYRIWRQLNNTNEPELFRREDFKLVVEKLLTEEIKAFFYENNGNFKTPVEGESLIALKKEFPSWDFSRIEIKEDFFFNKDNLMGDTRTLGVSFYKNKEDLEPSYIFYYPHMRAVLAKIKMESMGVNEINHLDDFFFFNEYRGEIVKSTSYNKMEVVPSIKIAWLIEIEKLVTEHNNWMYFGR